MTSIDDLKKERSRLISEKRSVVDKQNEEIMMVRSATTSQLIDIDKKIKLLDNQINSKRKPGIAKNVKSIKGKMRL